MSFDIHRLLAAVATHRPLFHSEADFQHSFAWEIHQHFPKASVRLERPISVSGGLVHLDVLVEHGATKVAIELKYKTRKFLFETPTETFSLRNHSAQDVGRYDFIKDICRLEDTVASYPDAIGFAVLLTNESAYWKESSSSATVDAAFRLHEGRTLSGEVSWGNGASAGTMKSREKPLRLRNSYSLAWRDFSSLSVSIGSTFRYLVVSVKQLPTPTLAGAPGGAR